MKTTTNYAQQKLRAHTDDTISPDLQNCVQ